METTPSTSASTGPDPGSSGAVSSSSASLDTSGSGSATADETGPACETCGGAACIDTTSDPAHCGGCDSPCPAGIACDAGSCACPNDAMHCGDACVDVNADGTHCGGCDLPCEPGLVCLTGVCSAGCGDLTECAGACVDTETSPFHCGGCDSPCPTGGTCEAGACACPGPAVSYAAQIEPLFSADCTSMGCHGFPMPQAQLDLRAGSGYAELIGIPASQCGERLRVDPGDPDASYLLAKLLGVGMCSGTRMPKAAAAYPVADIELVTAWICQGAPP